MARLGSRHAFISGVVFLVLGVGIGCSDDDDVEKVGNGVNDIRKACDIRTSWNRANNECSLCEAGAIAEHCECESLKAFSGKCLDQQNTRKAACAETVDACVVACDRSDCTCIDKCYGTDACRQATAARDGCVAAVCTNPFCK